MCLYCSVYAQSSSVAGQLESTQVQLASVSAELHSMQQLLQQQRLEHAQALMAATAAKQASADQHQLLQQREVAALQLSEQRLGGELSEAKKQLTEVLQDLENERANSGRLHNQVARLQNEFADTRAVVEAERQRAAALSDERMRLEAALRKAAGNAAAAEAAAAAARQQAQQATQDAKRAAVEAEVAQAKLSEVKEVNKELGLQLHVAQEVVSQQQAALQQHTHKVATLQEEVVVTRECFFGVV